MTGKVLSFPDGKEVPVDKTTTRETIADHQTKKFADSLADDLVIQMVSSMQQDGLNIGKASGHKTFLDVGIFLEALRALIYREFDLQHPFHNITDKMMYVEKVKGRKYSVVNYSGTKIEKVPEPEPDNVVEFESDIDFNDTD
jgi:hypothetical protein|tara:strand:+ start:72 stop:497 length:426 start_codon:yes stop_codon:yes gene_type:complete